MRTRRNISVGSLRNGRGVAPRAIAVLAVVGTMLCDVDARAQTVAALFPDAFTTTMQSDPRNPPRFRKFDRTAQEQLAAPPTFTPPASGAGATGFDSTNARKIKPKTKGKALANAQPIAPGVPMSVPA